MRVFVAILATFALLFGALLDTVTSLRYEGILTGALICEALAGVAFILLFKNAE